MAESNDKDGGGALLLPGGRDVQPELTKREGSGSLDSDWPMPIGCGIPPELTDNKFADIDYSDAWDDVGTEWTELAKTQQAAWAEHDRMHHYWMMAALDRRLPKRSYEAMLPENRVPVTQ